MKIKIAVSSNINYYLKTCDLLLNSLYESGIEKDDIKVFINASPESKIEIIDGIEYIFMNNCCVELAPLLYISENNLHSDYWFLIHDTCKVGLNFKKLLYQIPENLPDTIAIRSFPSMNIGSYKYSYLLQNKDKLRAIISHSFSTQQLINWKNWGVQNEDYLLWKHNPNTCIYNSNNKLDIIENDNWYNTPTPRRTEYFYSIDLYKNKSNWGQSTNFTVNV